MVLAASPGSLQSGEPHSLEIFAEQFLRGRGVEVVLAREAFQAAMERDQLPLADYFIPSGPGMGHPNARGNQVLLECVLKGISAPAASD